jgi:trehalose 6-phosphate phosphatase
MTEPEQPNWSSPVGASDRLTEAGGMSSLAFFLDVDGTLLEIAATPGTVDVKPEVLEILKRLYLQTAGAVALVSGRSIVDLDQLFTPLSWSLPLAGLHGFERRTAAGTYHRCTAPAANVLDSARAALHEIAARHMGTLIEDKEFALALHYRLAPEAEGHIARAMQSVAEQVRPHLVLQPGKMVFELRPTGSTKGEAVRAFLSEPPFRGRQPIYIGDDLTDESAFECVNAVGGASIAVNVQRPTAAQFRLPNVASVHTWLSELPASLPALLGAEFRQHA